MRVISGKYRGKRLLSPEGKNIRPTSDMIKENIFNTIQFDIEGSSFVDLFCGSGNIGIEALSRGAKVIFADRDRNSIALTKENLKGIKDEYIIRQADYSILLNSIKEPQDFIFVDPPYETNYIYNICEMVDKKNLLSENGYIIYEHWKEKCYELPNSFCVGKTKRYGSIVVDYIRKANEVVAVTGSFDPITNGHLWIIEQAAKMFDRVVILIASNIAKVGMFNREDRKEIVKLAINDMPNISVDICDGYVYDYCNKHNIKTIVRGYRNQKDYEYERLMSKYNEEHGNVSTLLVQSKEDDVEVSSTATRLALESNTTLKGLVPEKCVKIIKKLYGDKYERS